FVAEHGDPEQLAAATVEHVLDQTGAGHAVADDDEVAFRVHVARTAQTLNSGISLVGSRAALVKRFADCSPPQWNGRKIVSSRIVGVSLSMNVPAPRRVVRVTRPPSARACRRAVAGCISTTGSPAASCSSGTLRVCVPDW